MAAQTETITGKIDKLYVNAGNTFTWVETDEGTKVPVVCFPSAGITRDVLNKHAEGDRITVQGRWRTNKRTGKQELDATFIADEKPASNHAGHYGTQIRQVVGTDGYRDDDHSVLTEYEDGTIVIAGGREAIVIQPEAKAWDATTPNLVYATDGNVYDRTKATTCPAVF